ncbi:MAG: sugar nucleotide-binding protein, partial [Nitrospinaceae bacterium]|nr:sugar nucleotide-binding protein [Nitrospinaceae bacterium]NIR54343.1 sugar nucleotide-binding protein [Nitrospinaceae bacterium]NIS84761.1 sugar nucleotide-binding protein [Nitrospinaceae bacterium]NIT81562.1 sugar nucleotide-binding protein [Nitrospinaceae bacterium]NIU43846.1 sugar nucleotide-binding protein [Nitrospinaceae bacterium]
MRILLTGKNGQIGWELQHTLRGLGELFAPGRDELDLARPDQIREQLYRIGPDLVVNAAAYTAVDRAEDEPEAARAANAEGPATLAEMAAQLGAALVHY